MTKQAGLWIDHSKAVIVIITDTGEEIKELASGLAKRTPFTRGRATEDASREDMRERQLGLRLNRFYDQVIAQIRQADAILILGPGEAKLELQKRLEREGLKNRILAVETADKQTNRQVAALVRQRFPA